jgi:hypothetical protein
MRNPSGFWGISSMSKSDFAFTVAAARLSTPIEIRSNVACASSLGSKELDGEIHHETTLCIAPSIARQREI